jgi:hypothetical protein
MGIAAVIILFSFTSAYAVIYGILIYINFENLTHMFVHLRLVYWGFKYVRLADYPALPVYLFIPIFYQTGKGMDYIYSVNSK